MANKTFSSSGVGMKWHKFLLFLLWLGAAANILSGLSYFLVDLYGELTAEIYAVAPSLAIFDMASGAVIVALGIFQFVMRGRLKRMCANGPALLTVSYVLLMIINIVTAVVPAILAPNYLTVDIPTVMGNVFGNVLWLSVNASYYKKRMDMFTE